MNHNLKNATLCLLVKKNNENEITDICLAMKKRGFGVGKINGVGGKVDKTDESIEHAVVREAHEEIGVEIEVSNLEKIAQNTYLFPNRPDFDMMVHVYFTDKWQNEPTESEEMKPYWFKTDEIPYEKMWSDAYYWLDIVLKDKKIVSEFVFKNDNENIAKFNIEFVEGL